MSEIPAVFLKIILILIISICCWVNINAQSDLTSSYSVGPLEEMKKLENYEIIMSNEYTKTFSRRGIDKSIKKNRFNIMNFTEDSFEFNRKSKVQKLI